MFDPIFLQVRSLLLLCFSLILPLVLFAGNTREDSLLKILPFQPEDSTRLKTLNELFKLSFLNNPTVARYYLDEGLALAQKLDKPHLLSVICNNFGVFESQMGNLDAALRYHAEAFKIRQETKDSLNLTASLLNIGNIYFKKGKYEQAIRNYQKSIEIHISRDDTIGMLGALGNIGTVYNEQGKFADALNVYLSVLAFYEKGGYRLDLAEAQYNVGNVYHQMSMLEEAVDFMNRALKNFQLENDLFGVVDVLQSLGELKRELDEPVMAHMLYEKAMGYADSLQDRNGQATCALGLGTMAVEEKDYTTAMAFLEKALAGYREIGRRKGEAKALNHIGWVLSKQKRYGEAMPPLEHSLSIATEVGAVELARDNYRLLAEAHAELGNFEEAYLHFRDFFEFHDSVFSETNAGRIAELNTRYKTHERQSEIAQLNLQRTQDQLRITRSRWRSYFLLGGLIIAFLVALIFYTRYRQKKKRNREIDRMNLEVQKQRDRLGEQNRQIREINANLEKMIESRTAAVVEAKNELDTFLYESAHALRRPLTRIEGLVKLISMEPNEEEKEAMRQKLAFTVKGMDRLLHKLIMVNENERREVAITKLDLDELVAAAKAEIGATVMPVHLVRTPELELFNDEYLVQTLLVNLLENAWHYRVSPKVRALEVWVRLTASDIEMTLEVEDNGRGIPQDQLPKVFDMFFRGYARSGSNGLGLYVAHKIAMRLHGKISISSTLDIGTKVTVNFPRHIM